MIQKKLEHGHIRFAMIIAERILINVGLEVLRTNRMIDTRDTTFNQRPEAFNAVGVKFATHILFVMVVDAKVAIADSSHSVIAGELIGEDGSVPIYILNCKRNDGMPFNIINYLCNDFAVPLGSTDYFGLTFRTTSTLTPSHPAYIGFINFYFTCKMLEILIKQSALYVSESAEGGGEICDYCKTLYYVSEI